MKTVLVPGAPWPVHAPEVGRKEISPKSPNSKIRPKPKKKPSKIARTDAKYIEWAGKTLGTVL